MISTPTVILLSLILVIVLLIVLSAQNSCNPPVIKRAKQELEISVIHE